ncbi:MAG: endolytic transglycosylase MltG [Alphaproteobacteria bacterium]|nr:MAG: endolytic transglycosylase MltG [Alphaproteobacteria bacterium]
MIKHIASNVITLLVVLLFCVGGIIAWGRGQIERPGPLAQDTVFEVRRGERLREISERLEAEGIIRSAFLFRIAARYSGADRKLKFGEYKIPAYASARDVLDIITSGRALSYTVTIPEGWTSWQVLTKLQEIAQTGLITCNTTEVPPEGSLAPDTYAFARGDSCEQILRRMTEAQHRIITEEWALRDEDLPLKDTDEALTLASIIEKETGKPEERALIASVFVNRLRKGMPLQTDPTVIYGITRGKGVLGRGLRRSELRRRTPWNTYLIKGLPPTPIANPGRAAIHAALHPARTNYLFFVADGTGGHVFAETIDEHNANVRKWRKIERRIRTQQQAGEGAAAAAE